MLGGSDFLPKHRRLLLSNYPMTSKIALDINKRKKVSNLRITQEQRIIEFCTALYCSLFSDKKIVKIKLVYDLICEQTYF